MSPRQGTYPILPRIRPYPAWGFEAQQSFHLGMVRDTPSHLLPANSVYDALDFFVHEPGRAWKRGGWMRHSATHSGVTTFKAVATLHIPTRVVAVGDNAKLYDVTSENSPQADEIGSSPIPSENIPRYGNLLIFTYPDASASPKKVYWNTGGSVMAIADLGGSPPAASRSETYADRIVLAAGPDPGDGTLGTRNRVWFSPVPDVEGTWNTSESWFDCDHEVAALATVGNALLIFGPNSVDRLTGGIPPGEPSTTDPDGIGDMVLRPLAGVGTTDARSVVHLDESVIFAGLDGVYLANAAGVTSLTAKSGSAGIDKYWRELFPLHIGGVHAGRQLIGGLLLREFYVLTVLDAAGGFIDCLCLHIPTRCWSRMTNFRANMYASGTDEGNLPDTYMASGAEAYVEKLAPILRPVSGNASDGDGTAVAPVLTGAGFGDAVSMTAYGDGWVTFDMQGGSSPTLLVATSMGPFTESFTTVDTLAESTSRLRWEGRADTQQLSWRLTQVGASTSTQILTVEIERRPFPEQYEVG